MGKVRFNTYDIVCSVTELQRLIGMRVNQVYDIDHKTYLIKLHRGEDKCVLLLESGNRFHTTAFEWPKNVAPSGFSMKLRKHLKNKRLESLTQMGLDRIVQFQFGTGEAAYHVILELYDRGNIILCDYEMTILNILRPRVEGETVRFAVREKYPVDRARPRDENMDKEKVKSFFQNAKTGDPLKKILNPNLDYGPAVINHVLDKVGLGSSKFGKGFSLENDLEKLINALKEAEQIINEGLQKTSKGYIVQKIEKRPLPDGGEEEFYTNQEFHPFKYIQHEKLPIKEYETFVQAVDEFFSQFESQKIDVKTLQQEREALKKLANVRKDHENRLEALEVTQESDMKKAELITRNQELVDETILAVRSLIASQTSWTDIEGIVKEALTAGDAKAACILGLKLNINHVTLRLSDPYFEEDDNQTNEPEIPTMNIDIDLDLSAYANARKYYDQKRSAAKKQQKTLESTSKALKSAERKTKQALKEIKVIRNINKARKVYWFEKFFWFISSENYLVIGGRDQQQNELIVKRYMTQNDIYVHADIQGASSVIIKNPTGEPVSPKTLNESGVMAVCYSVAWDAKVLTNAWWVHSNQVSKTAPTGEYLQTGSFMIRGKKNYLLPANLIMGFSFLFKLEESSVARHKNDRKIRSKEEENSSISTDEVEQEIDLGEDSSGDDEGEEKSKEGKEFSLDAIKEEITNIEEINENDAQLNKCDDSFIRNIKEEIEAESDDEEEIPKRFPEFQGTNFHEQNNAKDTGLDDDDVAVIVNSKPTRQKQNTKPNKKSNNKEKEKEKEMPEIINQEKEEKKDNQIKRGQKSKLKKIKEKYKYQDEEERKLRMEILQSAGNNKDRKGKNVNKESVPVTNTSNKTKKPNSSTQTVASGSTHQMKEGEDEPLDEEPNVSDDVEMINSLTGQPLPEDEILFAIPVVAPYSTLQNYKFKVKLTPGTGKRGKAGRTALTIFSNDKTTTQREKDLIRSVKDPNMAINMPGKVKVSAPQLLKKKK